MPKNKKQTHGHLVVDDKVQQSISFIDGFGLPVDIKSSERFVTTVKKTNNGTITNEFVPGNEDDQIRVYYALAMRAKKSKKHVWFSKFDSYRELAKVAFDARSLDSQTINRAKKALFNLRRRGITFEGTFLDRDENDRVVLRKGLLSFGLVTRIIKEDDSPYLRIELDKTLMDYHYDGVKEQINHSILNAFGRDQFTRRLYLWLTAKFWGRKKLHPRTTETFIEEFGLADVDSRLNEPKYLHQNLKKSIKKIWKVLITNEELFVYWVDIKDNVIKFRKERFKGK